MSNAEWRRSRKLQSTEALCRAAGGFLLASAAYASVAPFIMDDVSTEAATASVVLSESDGSLPVRHPEITIPPQYVGAAVVIGLSGVALYGAGAVVRRKYNQIEQEVNPAAFNAYEHSPLNEAEQQRFASIMAPLERGI